MIDTHVHFWNFDPVRDSWINDEMKVIQNDFLPKDLAPIFEPLPLTGCVAVQANQNESETEFLCALSDENPIIKGIVGFTDLNNPALEERLEHWKKFEKIKGWRHVLQAEPDEFFLAPSFVNGLKLLKKYDCTYDLLMFHHQAKAMIELVAQVPDQKFVLDHCGKPDIKSGSIGVWTEDMKTLAQNKNVSCKLSGLLTEADWYNWTEKQIFDCFDVVLDSFGAERIMYGSDWPVMTISRPYADWFNLVDKYCAQFSEVERKAIFQTNAENFYRLF